MVPAANVVKNRIAPRHAVVRTPPRVIPATLARAEPCAPTLTAASLGAPQIGVGALSSSLSALDTAAAETGFAVNGSAVPVTSAGSVTEQLALANGGSTFANGGGGGGGGTPIGGGGGEIPPIPSSAPEPTSWALMIIGFGLLGGAMRYWRPASI